MLHAFNITLQELKDNIYQLDKNFQFVTVCGKDGGILADGEKLLKAHRLNAIRLCGGTTKHNPRF